HLRNCLLCHAPSTDRTDPIRAPIPTPLRALPVVYYDSFRGDAVRADTTYFRQDFSVQQPVEKSYPWPPLHRFDYLVRQRPLSQEEIKKFAWTDSEANRFRTARYPQREAILFALRELTGKDVGTESEDWAALIAREKIKSAAAG